MTTHEICDYFTPTEDTVEESLKLYRKARANSIQRGLCCLFLTTIWDIDEEVLRATQAPWTFFANVHKDILNLAKYDTPEQSAKLLKIAARLKQRTSPRVRDYSGAFVLYEKVRAYVSKHDVLGPELALNAYFEARFHGRFLSPDPLLDDEDSEPSEPVSDDVFDKAYDEANTRETEEVAV